MLKNKNYVLICVFGIMLLGCATAAEKKQSQDVVQPPNFAAYDLVRLKEANNEQCGYVMGIHSNFGLWQYKIQFKEASAYYNEFDLVLIRRAEWILPKSEAKAEFVSPSDYNYNLETKNE